LKFTIYPAVDLRDGSVVRLEQGDPERQTTFGSDAGEMARKWVKAGARWLHVVNLDGAFDEAGSANWQVLPEIAAAGAEVQFGGGLRSLEDAARALQAGVSRIVLGTVAVENPDLVAELVHRYGSDRVAVGIDARDGQVRTRGWHCSASISSLSLAMQMRALGIQRVIYTDIARDGLLRGVNGEATRQLAQESGLSVIASGGAGSLDDVRAATALAPSGVDGLIIGRALYDDRISLEEALAIAAKASNT
jgi:phosphoribosylformimino-5-aminoimidazole carboxamide ribotide isomerase